jgi:hypothetical protein
MAMDTVLIDEVWRPYYGKLVKGFQVLTPEWAFLKKLKNFDQLSPRQIVWPVDLITGGGIAMTYDAGPTARATSNEPVEATDTWKHMTGRFEVSYDVLTLNNSSKVAKQQIVKQVRYQVRDKLKSFKKRMSFGFYGHNDGVLHLVNSAAGAPTYTVKDRYGETGLAADVSWLTPGKDYVAVIETGVGLRTNGIQLVSSVNRATPSITLAGSPTGAATGDQVVLANHIDGTTFDLNRGMNGMLDITSAATLHNIATSAQPDWSAGIDTALSAALSGAALYKAFELSEKESGYRPDFAWTTIGAIAQAGGSELDQRRYSDKEDTMRLGFRKLNVMGVQTEGMLFCPPGHFFCGSSKALKKLSPDEDVKVVATGGPQGGFVYYQDQLGYFKDQVFRVQLTALSRKSFIHWTAVTEA